MRRSTGPASQLAWDLACLAGAVVVALAPTSRPVLLVVCVLGATSLLLLRPVLTAVLAALLPLLSQLSAISVGLVTLPRLLALLLLVHVLASAPDLIVPAVRALAPALVLFAWLAVRSLRADNGVQQALDMLRLGLLALVVFVLAVRYGARRLRDVLAVAALVFLALNSVLGDTSATGERWQGLTGNPNQLALVVAVLAPFCLCRGTRALGRDASVPLALAYVALALPLLVRSQSREGLVIFGVACFASFTWVGPDRASARWTRGPARGLLVGLLFAGGTWFVLQTLDPSRLDPQNLSTLSGRVDAFGKAWDAFLAHPLLGAGTAGQFVEIGADTQAVPGSAQSAHNAYLSVLGQGGLLAGVLAAWVMASGWLRRSAGPSARPVVLSLLCLAVASLVGDLHVVEVTWFVYALARAIRVGGAEHEPGLLAGGRQPRLVAAQP